MKVIFSDRFQQSYQASPIAIQRAFDRKLDLLLKNLRHPSLHAKKYDEGRGVWQARVTLGWRFYFTIEDDAYHLHDIIPHPK